MSSLELGMESRSLPQFEGGMIPLEELGGLWPQICGELDKVPHIWARHWTKEYLYEGVMVGRFQIWGFGPPGHIHVVVFTEIAVFPANRIFRVFLAFGNSLEQALPIIEAVLMRFAQVSGCSMCEVIGRVGWKKKLPRLKRDAAILWCMVEKERVH